MIVWRGEQWGIGFAGQSSRMFDGFAATWNKREKLIGSYRTAFLMQSQSHYSTPTRLWLMLVFRFCTFHDGLTTTKIAVIMQITCFIIIRATVMINIPAHHKANEILGACNFCLVVWSIVSMTSNIFRLIWCRFCAVLFSLSAYARFRVQHVAILILSMHGLYVPVHSPRVSDNSCSDISHNRFVNNHCKCATHRCFS